MSNGRCVWGIMTEDRQLTDEDMRNKQERMKRTADKKREGRIGGGQGGRMKTKVELAGLLFWFSSVFQLSVSKNSLHCSRSQ